MSDFHVWFFDVGQGDCSLLRFPDDSFMLIDVYRCRGAGIDIFRALDDILPDGQDGKKRLEHLVISHAHDDHITGIGDLHDRYEVGKLWLPMREDRKQIAKNFAEYQRVVDAHPDEDTYRPQGSRTPLAGLELPECVSIRCFSPPGYIDIEETLTEEEAKQKAHENCLVLRVCFEDVSVIFTGDSNLACWERVVGYYEGRSDEKGLEVLDSVVLHASHHGSRSFVKNEKDNEPWLEALETISPEWVIVSVGENNRHDHPHEDMMRIYRDQSGTDNVLETRLTGTVILEVDSDGAADVYADDGRIAEDYGWDDDGDDEDGGEDDDDRGGLGKAAAVAGVAGLAASGIAARKRSRAKLDNSPAA